MELLDYASKAAVKIAMRQGKKDSASPIPEIEDGKLINIEGNENGIYNVGFAMKDITPADLTSHTYWMAGYNIAKRITGFLDPLTVSAMWIDCGKEGVLLVCCDLIGLTGFEVREIRNSLNWFCESTGCRKIIVSCTHTHAGIDTMGYWGPLPKTGKDKKFMETVKSSIAEVCKASYENRRAGKLFYGNIDAPELIERWRDPQFFVPRLHRFRFVPDDGTKETWYLNFPAHPNTMGGKNKLLSADYPCYMRREIGLTSDANIMFSVGAIGAMDMGKVAESNIEKTMRGGQLLGRKAFEISNEKQLDAKIKSVTQHFVMPIDNNVLSTANALGVFNTIRCHADSVTGSGFISEVSYLSLGDAQIVTLPGESFQELIYPGGYCDENTSSTGEGAEINPPVLTDIFGDENLVIFGLTNDMAGYALAENDFILHATQPFISRGKDRFGRNHYHETNSCGIKTGATIANACLKMKKALTNEGKD